MNQEYERAKQMEAVQEKKRWEESVEYQHQLERQLQEQEHIKQKQYEEFLKEKLMIDEIVRKIYDCLLYTSPSPRDKRQSRMPSSA